VNVYSRLYVHTAANLRAEKAQQQAFERRGPWNWREEEDALDQIPTSLKPLRSTAVKPNLRIEQVIAYARSHISLREQKVAVGTHKQLSGCFGPKSLACEIPAAVTHGSPFPFTPEQAAQHLCD
jgi:hypothetical protein